MPEHPLVVVIAGPNGAGKSTAAPRLLRGVLAVHEFVNADPIAQGLSGFDPQSAAMQAGRIMLDRLRHHAAARVDFAFETTLASRTFAPWLQRLRVSGYRAHMTFLMLPSVELALARVAERVRLGGHAVPEDVVRRRFRRGLQNFFDPYRALVDSWEMVENADLARPRVIAARGPGGQEVVHDRVAWESCLEAIR